MDRKRAVAEDRDHREGPERGPAEGARRAYDVRKTLIRASQRLFEHATKKLDESDALMKASDHVAAVAVRGTDAERARLLENLARDVPEVVPS